MLHNSEAESQLHLPEAMHCWILPSWVLCSHLPDVVLLSAKRCTGIRAVYATRRARMLWTQEAVFPCGQIRVALQRYNVQSAKGNVKYEFLLTPYITTTHLLYHSTIAMAQLISLNLYCEALGILCPEIRTFHRTTLLSLESRFLH